MLRKSLGNMPRSGIARSSRSDMPSFLRNRQTDYQTKLKSKWIKDLYIKPDTLKLREKKLGKTLEEMGTGENFLNRIPVAYALRSRIDKWDLIKLQNFCK